MRGGGAEEGQAVDLEGNGEFCEMVIGSERGAGRRILPNELDWVRFYEWDLVG